MARETAVRRSWVRVCVGAPVSGRTMRELLYAFSGLPIAVISFAYAITALATGIGLLITFLGIPVLAVGLAGCRGLGHMERGRARALLRLEVTEPEPVRTLQRSGGLTAWVGAVLRSGVSWRHMLYSLLHLPWALFSFTASLFFWLYGWGLFLYPLWQWIIPSYAHKAPMQISDNGLTIGAPTDPDAWVLNDAAGTTLVAAFGLLLVLVTPWIVRGLVQIDKLLVLGLLGPSSLATRVWELESDRGVVVDTAAADLRRIERDLHDGAQARLVALAMELGLAKEKLLEDPQAGARMVDDAHGEVKLALQELRDLARGIHPAILTDRGLGPALTALGGRCTVPVRVHTDLEERPAAAIEGIAYFTVSELLQNVSKHSAAHHASVEVWRSANRLLIQVWDNGQGGATAETGTGLAGLADRLNAVDGLLLLDSPTNGPTTITAELPWR
ncbi:sensor histidine kinase [Streptomyces iconiensis]|uniref:histidine kinase n=1 Tax=Streptomyces iconiensis TaxID=1384038 RepID=A0ABT6ZXE0_9ACTN|nr:sensor histidine kinase [Streptomyces iconiensis]MDJ1133725.1 sensor domain-containing protein [Streptomyces iconiensis]